VRIQEAGIRIQEAGDRKQESGQGAKGSARQYFVVNDSENC